MNVSNHLEVSHTLLKETGTESKEGDIVCSVCTALDPLLIHFTLILNIHSYIC